MEQTQPGVIEVEDSQDDSIKTKEIRRAVSKK
jgi:hypothetical protein